MASRSRHSSRSDRDSDSMEALKPLVVLMLFGTILYGAYSVVQKGPSTVDTNPPAVSDAPRFAPPVVDIAASGVAATPPASQTLNSQQPRAAAPEQTPPRMGNSSGGNGLDVPSASPPPSLPTQPPPAPLQASVVADAAAAAVAHASRVESTSAPTYLTAQSAPPPVLETVAAAATPATPSTGDRPDRYASLTTTPPAPTSLPSAGGPPPTPAARATSAAFATAWTDAHEKLTAGRYAEALAALSIWYDDPSLGLEESHRLEDLLGQLAGTVIYSQEDLLLPPHLVSPGETLPALAASLGISWQLLGKINGIADPHGLAPGEHLKMLRGPFDAVVSVSRRRLSLQLAGSYAGSFPVVVGRQFLSHVGSAIPVAEIRRGHQLPAGTPEEKASTCSILLADGLMIEALDDPGAAGDSLPVTSLVVSVRDLGELIDILGPGSRVLIRQ